MTAESGKWWFNLKQQTVEYGPQSGMGDRIGPYESREEAEAALHIAAQRAEEWAEEERKEREERSLWGEE